MSADKTHGSSQCNAKCPQILGSMITIGTLGVWDIKIVVPADPVGRDPVRTGMISPLHRMPFGGIIVTCSSTEAFEDANVGRAPGFCAYFRLFAMGSLSLPRFRRLLKMIISKSSP